MNAKIRNTLFACFVSVNLFSQQIVSGEYFFDTAPALGGGTAFTVTPSADVNHAMSIPTTSLSSGFHNLFIRVKNNLNIWSHYEGRMVYIMPTQILTTPNLVSGEYFMDTDPGLGNGTAIPFNAGTNVSPSLTVPTSSLASGIHNLFIRVKNTAGKWSHYEGRMFYVMPTISASLPNIVSGEYFIDTDPGLGNGSTISFTAATTVTPIVNINTSSLSSGFHNLFFRVKNSAGIWSHYEGRLFYIMPNVPSTSPSILNGEYFVDTDPGLGNGTAISFTSGINVSPIINVNTTSLAAGNHNLFIRVKNSEGKWSHYEGRSFLICANALATSVISGNTNYCSGQTIVLNGTSVPNATSYLWSGPNGYTVNGLSMLITNSTVVMSGNYVLKAIRAGGTLCDTSSISYAVTVNPTFTTNNSQTICQGESYIVGANTYTTAGNYTDVLQSIHGCDSTVNTVLTITNVQLNLNVTTSVLTISSAQNSGSYQWIDCATNGSIAGANAQDFTATSNGSYAVILSECGVSDTSNCVVINNVGLQENNLNFSLQLYPNPTDDILTIELIGSNLRQFIVTDLIGKILSKQLAFGNTNNLNVANLSSGVYFVNIETEHGVLVRRFVKR